MIKITADVIIKRVWLSSITDFINYEYFHPAFLYESILDLLIFFVLFFIVRKFSKNYYGFVFASYLLLYSVARIIVESVRIDRIFYIMYLPLPIFVSILLIFVSVIMFLLLYKKYFKM